jgi:hypothetical protein
MTIYMIIFYSLLLSFPSRVLPVPLAPEAPPDPQELMALRDPLVVLETLVLLE